MSDDRPIGVLGALRIEIDAILEAADLEAVEEHASMLFHLGKLAGTPVVVAQCSAGKVNAALCAQVMIDCYRPRAVLNLGVAGGLGATRIGDVVVAEGCVQYDFDTTLLGEPAATISVPPENEMIREFPCDPSLSACLVRGAEALGLRVSRGMVCTGDAFVADPVKARFLHDTYGALACEMEGAAVAHTCFLNRIPCAVLRTVSDNANDDASVDFPTFAAQSAAEAQRLLTAVIGEL